MEPNDKTALPGEEFSKRFLNSPYFQAFGVVFILFTLSLAALYFQYNQIESLADSARSQAGVIRDEYDRFKVMRDDHDVLVGEVAKMVMAERKGVNDFETFYLRSVIDDINALASSDVYRGGAVGDISPFLILLRQKLEMLRVLYQRLNGAGGGGSEWNEMVMKAALAIADQANISAYAVSTKQVRYANKVTTPYYRISEMNLDLKSVKYDQVAVFPGLSIGGGLAQIDYSNDVVADLRKYSSLEKLRLMRDAFKFAGEHGPVGDPSLTRVALNIINSYRCEDKVGDIYPYVPLIQVAFEFLSVKGLVSEGDMRDIERSGVLRNVFGASLTDGNASNLIQRMIPLFSKTTVQERVAYYNEWIYKSWTYPANGNGMRVAFLNASEMDY